MHQKDIRKFREILSRTFDFRSEMARRGVTQDDLDTLKDMALSSEFIPRGLIDLFLYVFFIGNNKNYDKTITNLHNFCQLVQDTPEIYDNRDVFSSEIQYCLENQYYIVLPPTPKNCNLIYHHKSNYDPKSYVYEDVAKTFLMTVGKDFIMLLRIFFKNFSSSETCLFHYGPRNGFVVVIDMEGSSIGHVLRAKLSFIRKGMRFLDDACPVSIREFHILNTVPFLDMILGE